MRPRFWQWIGARRRAGHDERKGAITNVVAATFTVLLICFYLWFYVFSNAFLIPFMPLR